MPTRRQALIMMVAAALMWSIAGVVTRQLDAARPFEVTFWRSAFNAAALVLLLGALRGPAPLVASLRTGGPALWLSGLCWCVMYTAFMLALTLTSVANVLITMALAPLFTALAAHFALGHRLARRTWTAIAMAGLGIAWIYAREVGGADARHLLGTAVALAVPVAAAVNWTLLQHLNSASGPTQARVSPDASAPQSQPARRSADMLPAVLIGALLSALLTLPLAWPMVAPLHDIGWLALLGVVQLAVPCLMAVHAARALSAPEIALLALLEVVFGVVWAWLGAGEVPTGAVLGGGMLVLAALAVNEVPALRLRH